jgi:hypothetical protein
MRRLELNLVIVMARMQSVEVGHTIHAQQYSLAIYNGGTASIAQGGLDYQRVTVAPIITVAREQPAHACPRAERSGGIHLA